MNDHDAIRRDRLKVALRENLKRRKAQARARAADFDVREADVRDVAAGPQPGSHAPEPARSRQED